MVRRRQNDNVRASYEMQKCAVNTDCHLAERKYNARFSRRAAGKILPILSVVHGLGCCPQLQPTPRDSASGDGIKLS